MVADARILRQVPRHSPVVVHARNDAQRPFAWGIYQRVRPPRLLTIKLSPQHDMLPGQTHILRLQFLWYSQRDGDGVFGIRLQLGNSQWVKLEHADLQALEVVKGLEAGSASVVRLARRRAEFAHALGRPARASRTRDNRLAKQTTRTRHGLLRR